MVHRACLARAHREGARRGARSGCAGPPRTRKPSRRARSASSASRSRPVMGARPGRAKRCRHAQDREPLELERGSSARVRDGDREASVERPDEGADLRLRSRPRARRARRAGGRAPRPWQRSAAAAARGRARRAASGPPHAVARETQIAVRGVAAMRDSRAARKREDLLACDREQRPYDAVGAGLPRTRERGDPAAALAGEGERFERVVVLVGGRDPAGGGLAGHLEQRGITGVASARPPARARRSRAARGGVDAPAQEGQAETPGMIRDEGEVAVGLPSRQPWCTWPTERRQPVSGASSAAPWSSAIESAPPETASKIGTPAGSREASCAPLRATSTGSIASIVTPR